MLGSFCVDWLRDANLLELDVTDYIDNKTISYIKTSEAIKKHISSKSIPLNIPDKIPMIVKPKKYIKKDYTDLENNSKEILGGYLLNGELSEDEIIIRNSRLQNNSIISEKNIIYDTINNMSSVGYKINKDVFKFILSYNENYNLTLINSKHPLEEKLESGEKKKLYKRELADLESFRSKRFVQENILALSDVFENVEEFFIPVRLDYRGRIYCSSNYLNYQGTELAKSLLMFSRGEKILKTDKESINYLKIFGANCFGNKLDKQSANDRIKWVEDNYHNIINFENGILIEQAESKLLFISFCFEYKKYILSKNDENEYFLTHLPIQLDATCNGYQHISMLGMDQNLSKKLNIKPSS
jgi:DNA-directed RNA polymerase